MTRARAPEPGSARRRHDSHREGALNIQILTQALSGSRLVRDYLSGEKPASDFFIGPPFSLTSFQRKWQEVQQRFGPAERQRAAAALRASTPVARQRLRRFVEEGGAVVTTGQQAGLFTGPLYTIYKALTAARLADTLEERLGIPVLPVFWTASEDHDWAEVDHADLSIRGHGVVRLVLPSTTDIPLPMSERVLGDGIGTVLDELRQLINTEPDASDVLTLVRAAYQPGATVAGAFSALMESLVGGLGVCMTDAADPALKQASAGVLLQALRESGEHEHLLTARSSELTGLGYGAQVGVLPGGTNVFHHGPRGRERLYRAGAGFVGHDSRCPFTLAELESLSLSEPGRLSPNVFLRPVVESAVFPTLAYVAGPGEIAYFAQLGALFPAFGMEPPVVFPRGSATLVEPEVAALASEFELAGPDLARPWHELVERLARRSVPAEVQAALEALSQATAGGYRRVVEAGVEIDAGLAAELATLRNQALATLARAERKVLQHVKRRETTAIGRLRRLRDELRPEGAPQERVLNVLPFLARHGRGLVDEIAGAMSVELHE
ncbi:MAG TPA: bacillithiol biosynthesis cysteine-adding enzyme BshC [Longimicrobiaceae bacterium]|nr:bacillithiol biosynthesis cysteine-adding enzyme BshC [Longimicrobiaceae bacterium]